VRSTGSSGSLRGEEVLLPRGGRDFFYLNSRESEEEASDPPRDRGGGKTYNEQLYISALHRGGRRKNCER